MTVRSRSFVGATLAVAAVSLLAACGVGVTGSASEITDHRARLTGKVGNVEAGATSYHFEYGTTDAYGSSTPGGTVPVAAPEAPWTVSDTVDGLVPGTEYHYRICAADAAGHGTCGDDATFTTHTGHDSVVGTGAVPNPDSNPFLPPIYSQIDAIADVDGSAPTGWALRSFPVPTGTVFQIRGDISCLRVEGNRATIGYLGGIAGIPDGFPTVLFVEDGAATATPDRFAFKDVAEAPTTCPAPNEADFPTPVPGGHVLLSGDFVVHDGS